MTWGVDTHVIERFGKAGVPKEKISMVKDTYPLSRPTRAATHLIESFRRYYGPTMNAFEAAEKNGTVDGLHIQLLALANAQNTSGDRGTSIPATFLRVTVDL